MVYYSSTRPDECGLSTLLPSSLGSMGGIHRVWWETSVCPIVQPQGPCVWSLCVPAKGPGSKCLLASVKSIVFVMCGAV